MLRTVRIHLSAGAAKTARIIDARVAPHNREKPEKSLS
jgi:hypothetical protein